MRFPWTRGRSGVTMADVMPAQPQEQRATPAAPSPSEATPDLYLAKLLALAAFPRLAAGEEDERPNDTRFWSPRTWAAGDYELIFTRIPISGVPGGCGSRVDLTMLYNGQRCMTASVRYKGLVGDSRESIVDAGISINFGTEDAKAVASCSWKTTGAASWHFSGDLERLVPGTAIACGASTFVVSDGNPPLDTLAAMLASVLNMDPA